MTSVLYAFVVDRGCYVGRFSPYWNRLYVMLLPSWSTTKPCVGDVLGTLTSIGAIKPGLSRHFATRSLKRSLPIILQPQKLWSHLPQVKPNICCQLKCVMMWNTWILDQSDLEMVLRVHMHIHKTMFENDSTEEFASLILVLTDDALLKKYNILALEKQKFKYNYFC